MKALTKNLLLFALFFFAGAVLFRYGLSYFLENRMFGQVWVIAVAYFFYNISIGWYFGKKDYEDLPLYDVGFRFHLATYVIFNLVSKLWFVFGYHAAIENIKTVHNMALYWGIGVVIHFMLFLISRKQSIKGIHKSDIFE